MRSLDVVTIGESMVVFNPMQDVSFIDSHLFMKQIAGSESNFAIGLSRLGHKVGWISRLSDDSFGNYINHVLRGNGVDTSAVQFDAVNPTGVLVKERQIKKQVNVHYYRSGSAASKMDLSIIDKDYFNGAKYLFITGITPALSDSNKATVYKAIDVAKELDIKIIFDPNVRYKLIEDVSQYRQTLNDIACKSDYFLPGDGEIEFLTGVKDVEEAANYYLSKNSDIKTIIKRGAKGCYFASATESYYLSGYKVEEVIDPIGAGDAFGAGFVSGLLEGKEVKEALKQANLIGSMAVQTEGDIEGFPFKNQLNEYRDFVNELNSEEVRR